MKDTYEFLKKQLQACIDSPLKDESLCDATRIIEQLAENDAITLDQKSELVEMYYLIKAKAIDPLKNK